MNALVPTLFGGVVAPLLLGAGVLRLLGDVPNASRGARMAWSYVVGHFLVAWCTYAWLQVVPVGAGWLLPCVIAAAGVSMLLRTRQCAAGRSLAESKALPAAIATFLLCLLVVDRCSIGCMTAIVGSDEANIWAAKARVLFAPGGMAAWAAANYVQAPDYPNFGPLVQALAFVSNGEHLLWENRIPVQGFAIALLVLLADELRRRTSPWLAMALLTAFATTAPFLTYATTVYSDVIVALSLLATVAAASEALRGGARSAWPLACIAASVLLAAKNEGRMLVLATLAAFAVASLLDRPEVRLRALGWRWLWIGLPLLTFACGVAFNAAHGLVNDHASPDPADGRGFLARVVHWTPIRLGPLLDRAWLLVTDGQTTRFVLPCVFLAPVIAGSRWRKRDTLVPFLVVVIASIGYGVVFLGVTASHPGPMPELGKMNWHFDVAADRLCLHLMPTAAIALAAAFGKRPGAAAS